MNDSLVSIERAKTHLRISPTDTTHDDDIETKMIQASAIVLHQHKLKTVPAEWLVGSPVTVDAPPNIQAATLLVLSELFENREASTSNPLSDAVKNLIPRPPTLA